MLEKTPQSGIFKEGSIHYYFLEYRLTETDVATVKQALAESRHSLDSVSLVLGFGLQAWQKLQPAWAPATLAPFTEIQGEQGHRAPSTQADVFFWIHGLDIAAVYDAVMLVHAYMKSVASLSLEQRGFDYHHQMDLMGFEDGTANPKTEQLKRDAAVIPTGRPGAGGSLVLSQKWVHDMEKWNHLPQHCQEGVIGRTKIENEELEGDAMPDDSHVSRTDLTVDGVAMKVYRRSAPYGTVAEKGLFYFVFGCDLQRFTTQLESMYGLTADKKIDQIINYSTAVSGSYWFAPAQEDLAELLAP